MVLLGTVALRAARKVTWDNKKGVISDPPNGADLVTKPYRKGWELPV